MCDRHEAGIVVDPRPADAPTVTRGMGPTDSFDVLEAGPSGDMNVDEVAAH